MNTFILSRIAPQSLFSNLLGCLMAWFTPWRISPIRMHIWATPARQASSCSWYWQPKGKQRHYVSEIAARKSHSNKILIQNNKTLHGLGEINFCLEILAQLQLFFYQLRTALLNFFSLSFGLLFLYFTYKICPGQAYREYIITNGSVLLHSFLQSQQ